MQTDENPQPSPAPGAGATSDLRGRAEWAIKSGYATTARGVGALLSRVGVVDESPPDRDRRLRHWLNSLVRVHDSLAIAELGVPWWTYRAIDFVDAWLLARPDPIRVFEYGSGASTLWLAERAHEVVTVEHHAGFADVIGPALAEIPGVTFRLVEPASGGPVRIGSAKPGNAGADFYDYVHAIDDESGLFDVVVIDGRAREACLELATSRLRPDGIVIFDNSRRRRYREVIEASELQERRLPGLTPTLPYPDQTSILMRPRTRP